MKTATAGRTRRYDICRARAFAPLSGDGEAIIHIHIFIFMVPVQPRSLDDGGGRARLTRLTPL